MKKAKVYIIIIAFLAAIISFILFSNPFLEIKLIGDAVVEISPGTEYVDLGAEAKFFNENLNDKIIIDNEVNFSKIGEYKIEYKVEKGLTTKKVVRTIRVIDVVPPTITLLGDSDVYLCGKEYVEAGYEASDDVDGDLTSKVVVTKENDQIIYTVVDSSGNKVEVIRHLIPNDTENPIIKLNNSNILTFKQGSTYKEFGATATDNCDGDITSKVEIISNVDTKKHEVFTVTYKVKDSAGNESTIERKIKVYNSDDLNKGYNEIVSGPTYIQGILIVNKKYSIPASFDGNNAEAKKALSELQAGAKKSGFNMPLKSGFRSYSTQKTLYANYVKNYGKEFADQRAARAGHSEHETGLGFDVGSVSTAFGNTAAGKWLRENCAKYGFIIRYPQYKEAITGYGYEPWHIRYVGVDIATEIMEKNITLEEYLGLYTIDDL